jgi:hypothetical protein
VEPEIRKAIPVQGNEHPDSFDALRVELVVENFVKALAINDLETQLRDYADRVDYYEFGQVDKDVISKDLKHDIATWPRRSYFMTGPPRISQDGRGFIVEFPMAYTLTSSDGTRRGMLQMSLRLTAQAERWQVAGIQKKVIQAARKISGHGQEVRKAWPLDSRN